MNKENKDNLIEASGFIWIAIMLVGVGVYALLQPMTIYSVSFGVLAIICGVFLILAITDCIKSHWKK